MASDTLTATVTPSPFRGEDPATAAVAVQDGQLVLSTGDQEVMLRPARLVLGHGMLQVVATDPRRTLLLRFEQYDVPKHARLQAAHLSQLYRRLDSRGLRDLLVALRDGGVRLRTSPTVRRGAGAYRATAWVSAAALLFVELGLFGLPAGLISALATGGLTTPTAAGNAALMTGAIAFVLLAIATSPVPLVVRRAFQQGSTRDPIGYLDTWAGRPPEQTRTGPDERLGFVPGVPVLPAVILAVACAFYAFGVHRMWGSEPTLPAGTRSGQPVVPEPAWLDGTAISLAGYAGMALLLVIFGISVFRWRSQPELHGIRWAPLVGAFLCFAFGQAGTDLRLNPIEEWLYLVLVVLVVAFTCSRVAIGFAAFGAAALFVLLAGFGFFESWHTIGLLLPALVLIAAIAVRYFPGGARLVALPAERAARTARVRWTLWAVTAALGMGLAVASASMVRVAATG